MERRGKFETTFGCDPHCMLARVVEIAAMLNQLGAE